jgi:hypothetical protein
VPSCLAWDSSYDLKWECVISACIISLYVWVSVYVGVPYLMLMSLSVGPLVCDVLFSCSFFSMACPGIQIFVGIGVYSRLCIGILDVFKRFLPYVESVLPAQMAVWDWCYWCHACIFLCCDVCSAADCWRGVELHVSVIVLYSDNTWCRI